jgi:hypothetical protein
LSEVNHGVVRPIAQLCAWEDNYNTNDVASIALSIRRYGFNNALRVWRDNIIMAGNHTFAGLLLIEAEGPRPYVDQSWPPANVTVHDGQWFVQVVDVAHLSDIEAKAFAIADNQLARQAVTDDVLLARYLQEIAEHDKAMTAASGFDDAAFDAMMKYLTADMVDDDAPSEDEWASALGRLPSGERNPIQEMAFSLHDDQAETVRRALTRSRALGPFGDTGNQNGNGNALARICEMWLGQNDE